MSRKPQKPQCRGLETCATHSPTSVQLPVLSHQGAPAGARACLRKVTVDDEVNGGLHVPLYIDYQPDPFGVRNDEFWNLAVAVDPAGY